MQKEIAALSIGLPSISEQQKRYAIKHCFFHRAVLRKSGEATCLECGHKWKTAARKNDICPHCHTKVQLQTTMKRIFNDSSYFGIITTQGEYQLLRNFLVFQCSKLGNAASYEFHEVFQEWIAPNGNFEIMSLRRQACSMYYDSWIYSGLLELRSNKQAMAYGITPFKFYPYQRVIPELKRNGYQKNNHSVSPSRLFKALLTDSRVETLFKAGQYPLVKCAVNGRGISDKMWESIRICLRNNYFVSDASMWMDMIDSLQSLGKDTRNAHYVCPENLQEAHDRWMRKNRARIEAESCARKRKQIAEYEREFFEAKSRFFGIRLSDEEIQIHVLSSVQEYLEEGTAMHHCVFDNSYFQKKDSLILSATINGVRIETVELSLVDFMVLQSRGVNNSNTPYHDRIIRLVENNAALFKNCMAA